MSNSLPLPLIDRCLFIDNSVWVEGFSSCYRYLEYKGLRQRISKEERTALNFGSANHLAFEYRYKVYQNRKVDDSFYEYISPMLTKFYEEHPVVDGDWRNLNWAMELQKRYNQRYEIEPFNLLTNKQGETLVELPFALPLCAFNLVTGAVRLDWDGRTESLLENEVGVIYMGKIDLPVAINGQIFVMDHKTSKHLGDMFWNEMRMTSQQRGYVWAFKKLTGAPVAGYLVNGIRTKEPPAYVTDPLSGRRNKKYTPESWWEESFQREQFLCSDEHIAEWFNNTVDLVEEFFWHYRRGYMPMKTKWCSFYGRCPYYNVCQLVPEDRLRLLNSGDFTVNTWSPLKKV